MLVKQLCVREVQNNMHNKCKIVNNNTVGSFQSDDAAQQVKQNPHFPERSRVSLTQPDDGNDQVRPIAMWMKTSQETTGEESLIHEIR